MLSLWIENQVGVDCDCTQNYIRATGWAPAVGVTLDGQILRGVDPVAVYAEFVALRNRVAAVGHGDSAIDAVSDEPSLTACMESDACIGYTSAKISLSRFASSECDNYESFRAACGDR